MIIGILVMSIPLTPRTKQIRICQPLRVFIGLNNHKQTILYGEALLYDKTIPSFQWLFKTLLKEMNGEKPKIILSNQDVAMARAISLVMQGIFHGLCTWHIRQNALRHVNHLYQKSSQFYLNFEACIDLYKNSEFFNAWNFLLVDHNIEHKRFLFSFHNHLFLCSH